MFVKVVWKKRRLQAISLQIYALDRHFFRLEDSTAEPIECALKSIIRSHFTLTVDGYFLLDKLAAAGFPASKLGRRDICEINKVANYWRTCSSFSRLACSKYRTSFMKLQLKTLEAYALSTNYGMQKFVHAEVQMVVYHETSSSPPWPWYIGVSKRHAFCAIHSSKPTMLFHIQSASQYPIPQVIAMSHWALSARPLSGWINASSMLSVQLYGMI